MTRIRWLSRSTILQHLNLRSPSPAPVWRAHLPKRMIYRSLISCLATSTWSRMIQSQSAIRPMVQPNWSIWLIEYTGDKGNALSRVCDNSLAVGVSTDFPGFKAQACGGSKTLYRCGQISLQLNKSRHPGNYLYRNARSMEAPPQIRMRDV